MNSNPNSGTNASVAGSIVVELRNIAKHYPNIPLCALNGNKQPQGDGWTKNYYTPNQLADLIEQDKLIVPVGKRKIKVRPQGIGVLTGVLFEIEGKSHVAIILTTSSIISLLECPVILINLILSTVVLILRCIPWRSSRLPNSDKIPHRSSRSQN